MTTSFYPADAEPIEVQRARKNLTTVTRDLCEETKQELGFGWRCSHNAPSTYEDLQREFRACRATGLPLRVSSLFCENTVYFTAEDNQAFRFVHDTRRVWLHADFDLEGELAVVSAHLARLRRFGFGPDSTEFRMLWADVAGQALFFDRTGYFPINQLRFVVRTLSTDVERAIDEELTVQCREVLAP